jgi:dTDP-4-amino-4,6-dideoxygalactose transaminase
VIPKQIIYPIDYPKALLGTKSAQAESASFRAAIGGILGGDVGVVPLGRARMGLHLLVKLAIAGPRRKVVLSPYTIPDVINMAVLAGGEPVFVDHAPRSTNVDLAHLESLLSDDVACVVLTHYHVNQNDFAAIKGLCEARGVRLFEDCAISLSATIGGRHVGTQSDGAMLSLSGFKFLNYYWGGCVFSRHEAYIDALARETRRWPRLGRLDYLPQALKTMKYDIATRNPVFSWAVFPLIRRRQRGSREAVNLSPPRLESVAIDRTLESLPSASALAEWNSKIPRLGGYLEHRRRIASIYDRSFGERMVSPESSAEIRSHSAFINYPIHVGEALRNTAYGKLIGAGYDVGASLYPNCHEHDRFRSAAGRSDNVRDLVRSVITLPTHPVVSEKYAHVLAEAVSDVLLGRELRPTRGV